MEPLARYRLTFAFFAAIVVALAIMVTVITVTGSVARGREVTLTAVVVTLVGLGFAALGRVARGPLHCGTRIDVLRSYRSRLVRCAFLADIPAGAGFAGFLLTDNVAVFMIGAGFSVISLVQLAPSRRNIEAEEHEFARRGCHQSLVGALFNAEEPPHAL